MSHKPTVCVDLDGTILEFDEWRGEQHFGKPITGARAVLNELKHLGWRVIIYTTRGNEILVRNALDRYGVPYDYINRNPDQPAGTNEGKPIADAYVDDRAVAFRGNWRKTLEEIQSLDPRKKKGG